MSLHWWCLCRVPASAWTQWKWHYAPGFSFTCVQCAQLLLHTAC